MEHETLTARNNALVARDSLSDFREEPGREAVQDLLATLDDSTTEPARGARFSLWYRHQSSSWGAFRVIVRMSHLVVAPWCRSCTISGLGLTRMYQSCASCCHLDP